MDFFPAFFDMSKARVVVFGSGALAARKIRLLARSPAELYLVGAMPGELVRQECPNLRIVDPEITAAFLQDVQFAVVAEEDAEKRASAITLVRHHHIALNVVDDPAKSDFVFPSLIERGRFVAGFTSGGAAPVLARDLRARFERSLPQGLAAFMREAGEVRGKLNDRIPDAYGRRRAWEMISRDILSGREPEAGESWAEWAETRITHASGASAPEWGVVCLEGRVPDDISLRTFRFLQTCDLAVIPARIERDWTDLIRKDAERIALAAYDQAIGLAIRSGVRQVAWLLPADEDVRRISGLAATAGISVREL
jgi:uroporphyrin-III C-methyltransferase/precorrin-2 dehydrogenase/sirohydrochlorin ferrochelatase